MATNLKNAICLGCLLALFGTVTWTAPVQAQGGFAMSGSFNSQQLELPQGTTLRTPDIYVVIFNTSSEDMDIKMTTNAPFGVTIVLPEYDFPLAANSQKKLEVGIDIGIEAAPGAYKIGITAQPYEERIDGIIHIIGGTSQEADLTVTGESSVLDISTISPDGVPVPARIILYRDYEGNDFEIARVDTGILNIMISPGSYKARAFITGNKLAEESFTIAADEQKAISLTVKTIYFEGFEIVPNYQKDNTLVMVQIVSTLNNLLDAFTDVKVNLVVSRDDQQENITIINLSRLEQGKIELKNNYIPADGWQQGVYTFTLQLEVGGNVYTASQAKGLKIDETGIAGQIGETDATVSESTTPTSSADTGSSTTTWVIIACVVVVGILIAITVIVLARRRK